MKLHEIEVKNDILTAPFLIGDWFPEDNIKTVGKISEDEFNIIQNRIKTVLPTIRENNYEYMDLLEFVHAWDLNIHAMPEIGISRNWGVL